MLAIQPFAWRRLTSNASLEHRLDACGALLLRGVANADRPPLATALVRDDQGRVRRVPIDALGFQWSRAAEGDGWMLRTGGPPITMANAVLRWDALVTKASDGHTVDERLLLVTIASELLDTAPDADNEVKAPNGERHGLMQTPIVTAARVQPGLFEGIEPSRYLSVLSDPAKSIACGAAYFATFGPHLLADPLAARIAYASGRLRPTPATRWGAEISDERVPLRFIAFWNDDAALRAGEILPAPSAFVQLHADFRPRYLAAAVALGGACVWLSYRALQAKQAADECSCSECRERAPRDDDARAAPAAPG